MVQGLVAAGEVLLTLICIATEPGDTRRLPADPLRARNQASACTWSHNP